MRPTPELLERIESDYAAEHDGFDWDAYVAGYMAAIKRFAARPEPGKYSDIVSDGGMDPRN